MLTFVTIFKPLEITYFLNTLYICKTEKDGELKWQSQIYTKHY